MIRSINKQKNKVNFADYLTQLKLVKPQQLEKFLSSQTDSSLIDYLYEKELVDKQQLLYLIREFYDLPYIDLENAHIQSDTLNTIPYNIARQNNLIVFAKNNNIVDVALIDPDQIENIEEIKSKYNYKINLYVTQKESIDYFLDLYKDHLEKKFINNIERDFDIFLQKLPYLKQDQSQIASKDLSITDILVQIIKLANSQNAKQIVFEPGKKEIMIYFRIDNQLYKILSVPSGIYPFLSGKIKELSLLSREKPNIEQSSRLSVFGNYNITYKTLVTPSFTGERIVLTQLDNFSKGLTFDFIGLRQENTGLIFKTLDDPNQKMILVSAPPQQGKSTTLYSLIDQLNQGHLSIGTIEDSIEFNIKGVNQTPINLEKGLNFSDLISGAENQDLDVLVVDEIKDPKIIESVFDYAFLKNFLMGSIEAQDSLEVLKKIKLFGIDLPFAVSQLGLIINQRLVDRICPHCIKKIKLSQKEAEIIKKITDYDFFLKNLAKDDSYDKKDLMKLKNLEKLDFYQGSGCAKCDHKGHKGQTGIYELLPLTNKIAKSILKVDFSDSKKFLKLKRDLQDFGFKTIYQDCFIKALLGITSFNELLKLSQEQGV